MNPRSGVNQSKLRAETNHTIRPIKSQEIGQRHSPDLGVEHTVPILSVFPGRHPPGRHSRCPFKFAIHGQVFKVGKETFQGFEKTRGFAPATQQHKLTFINFFGIPAIMTEEPPKPRGQADYYRAPRRGTQVNARLTLDRAIMN